MASEHWDVIEAALQMALYQNYENKREKLAAIDAALAFVRQMREAVDLMGFPDDIVRILYRATYAEPDDAKLIYCWLQQHGMDMPHRTKMQRIVDGMEKPVSIEEDLLQQLDVYYHIVRKLERRTPAASQQEAVPAYHSLPASEMVELRNAAIKYFYHRVCERAEKNMELTNTVSGAHWNAMKQVLAQMHIEADS